MPRLTSDQWLEARQAWESDATLSFSAVAKSFDVSTEAVSLTAKKQGWMKAGGLAQINRAAQTKADKLDCELDGKLDASSTKKEPLATSVEASTDLRAKLIHTHRTEWRKHAALYPLEDIKADFAIGKSGKISAELIAIRQKAERAAWGMDEAGAQQPREPGAVLIPLKDIVDAAAK